MWMTRTLVTSGLVVLLAGLAVAQDDKVLVVRDGSVLLSTDGASQVGDKKNNKHKWSSKARTVQIFAGSPDPCATPHPQNPSPLEFASVELIVEDTSGGTQPFPVTARNEWPFFLLFFIKHLKLEVPPDASFEGDEHSRKLQRGGQADTLRLSRIVVRRESGVTYTFDRSGGALCARFRP